MPFSRLRKGAFCIFLNPRLNGKPGVVHLYWQLMACRVRDITPKERYLKILEFRHFVEFFSFNKIGENHREKELVRKVTVVAALDLGCWNTKNSEYESK